MSTESAFSTARIGAVAIGRNEGERLISCLTSLKGKISPLVYVDSGSTDDSVDAARKLGAEVVQLDMTIPFTAARARNAGYARLKELMEDVEFVQFLDGDCDLADGWVEVAIKTLGADPGLAIVCGRRRERFPDASIWNRLIDKEWDTPIGDALACGGDALIRRHALDDVAGYREDLIAGEEPEMCYRLRAKGWRIRRVDAEMTLHDAAMTRMSQWWQRSKRAGHAFAEVSTLHRQSKDGPWRTEARRSLIWGAVPPTIAILGSGFISMWFLAILVVWPMQMLRMRRRGATWRDAIFLTLCKIPEAQGSLEFHAARLTGGKRSLIEYK